MSEISAYLCAICHRKMIPNTRLRPTNDHIIPREWAKFLKLSRVSPLDDTLTPSVKMIKIVCMRCNRRRAQCGHCVGALACITTISDGQRNNRYGFVFKKWKMGKVAAKLAKHFHK